MRVTENGIIGEPIGIGLVTNLAVDEFAIHNTYTPSPPPGLGATEALPSQGVFLGGGLFILATVVYLYAKSRAQTGPDAPNNACDADTRLPYFPPFEADKDKGERVPQSFDATKVRAKPKKISVSVERAGMVCANHSLKS